MKQTRGVFSTARQYLSLFEREFVRKWLHLMPFAWAGILFLLWFFFGTSLLPAPNDTAEMFPHVSIAIAANTFLLGAVASIILMFHRGLLSPDEEKLIRETIAELPDYLAAAKGEVDLSLVTDFQNCSEVELRTIRISLRQMQRLFEWTNYAMFCTVMAAMVLFLFASIHNSSFVWHLGMSATMTVVVMMAGQSLTAIWPRFVKTKIRGCVNEAQSYFDDYSSEFAALPQQVTKYSKLAEQLNARLQE